MQQASSTVFILSYNGPDLSEALCLAHFGPMRITEVHSRGDAEYKLAYVRHKKKVTCREWMLAVADYNQNQKNPEEHLRWVGGGLCAGGAGRYLRCSPLFKFIIHQHEQNDAYFAWRSEKRRTQETPKFVVAGAHLLVEQLRVVAEHQAKRLTEELCLML